MTALRVAAVATPLWTPASADEWAVRMHAAARFAADGGAALVVFGEYATAPLLALDPDWTRWDGLWVETARRLARSLSITVCAGTHLVRDQGRLVNRCLVVRPDGSGWTQDKLHPTPWERSWLVEPTSRLRVAEIAGARTAVLTCYDIEFPEAARAATQAGAEILLVPSWTDDRQGFWRVRHCAHARAVEDTCAVVHAPLIGSLPTLPGFEQAVGAAGILGPCDTGTAPDGIAAAGGWCIPEVVLADIDLGRIRQLRHGGTVTPLADARGRDGYQVETD